MKHSSPASPPDADAGLIRAPDSPLEETLRLARVVAPKGCPVFLRGESGSGKELLARFLHQRSGRAAGPFVAVNCAAISPHLIESELFGHRKGAFTGAWEDHPGKFRLAEGGTLFLDEVGDMPPEVQTRLLRVLQEKMVSPVGERREYPVDFRLVCATHRDLGREVREGRFREDLYYRLNVVDIRIPALRERSMDIPLLVRAFLSAQIPGGEVNEAMAALPPFLLALPFPGNVRELRNLVDRYCVMRELGGGWDSAAQAAARSPDSTRETSVRYLPLDLPGLPPAPAARPPDAATAPLRRIRNSRVTDGEILRALGQCGYHRARTSLLLGISRRALQYRLAKMQRIGPGFAPR